MTDLAQMIERQTFGDRSDQARPTEAVGVIVALCLEPAISAVDLGTHPKPTVPRCIDSAPEPNPYEIRFGIPISFPSGVVLVAPTSGVYW